MSRNEPIPRWKEALRNVATGLVLGGVALGAAGCAPSERVVAASPSPEAPQPSPDASETQGQTGEGIGQDTEIPREQLNIMEQTTTVEEMLAMSDEERAHLSVGDRAALGYYITQKIVPQNQLPNNVGYIDADPISFYNDTENNIRSGTAILGALGTQYGSLVYANENEACAFAVAMWYDTAEGGGIAPYVKEQIADNVAISQKESVSVETPSADGETGWFEVDDQGEKQWVKVIHEKLDGVVDRTSQYVRVTVHTLEGEDIFFYMQARTDSGDQIEEIAKLPISK